MTTKAPPRLPLIETPEDQQTREAFARLASAGRLLNLHRTMAYAPAVMKASGAMAIAFRQDAKLGRAIAEIVVLRTSQLMACDYIWARHVSLAREAGVTEQQMADIARWPSSSAFTREQKLALAYTEKAVRAEPLDDAAFADLRGAFSPREIVELAKLVGLYVSTAIFIKTLMIPDEKE